VSVNRVIFVVCTINVQHSSFYSGLCNKRGWGYGFFISECVRGEICNDMRIWKWPYEWCDIFIPIFIGEGNNRDIIRVIRRT
jgi:hypothetical protein